MASGTPVLELSGVNAGIFATGLLCDEAGRSFKPDLQTAFFSGP